jgi:hypothetical protein
LQTCVELKVGVGDQVTVEQVDFIYLEAAERSIAVVREHVQIPK